MIPEGIQASVADFVAKILGQELNKFLDNPRKFFQEEETNEIKAEINRIVVEKVNPLNVAGLENIVYAVADRELKHIEIIGRGFGFSDRNYARDNLNILESVFDCKKHQLFKWCFLPLGF